MHDTQAGYRVDITDLTTGRARLDDGQRRERLRARPVPAATRPSATSRRTPSTRCTTPPSSAARPGARTRRSRCRPTRSGTSSTATRSTRNGACTQPGAGEDTLDADDQACLDGAPARRADPDHRLRPGRRRLRRAVLPARLAGIVPRTRRSTRKVHGTPFRFTVPSSRGKQLENVSFENDLARIERRSRATFSPSATRRRASTASARRWERSSIRSTRSPVRAAGAGSSRATSTSPARSTASAGTPMPSTGTCCS